MRIQHLGKEGKCKGNGRRGVRHCSWVGPDETCMTSDGPEQTTERRTGSVMCAVSGHWLWGEGGAYRASFSRIRTCFLTFAKNTSACVTLPSRVNDTRLEAWDSEWLLQVER